MFWHLRKQVQEKQQVSLYLFCNYYRKDNS